MGLLEPIKKRKPSSLFDLEFNVEIPDLDSSSILFNALSGTTAKNGWEGFKDTPYKDGEVMSIGFGRRAKKGESKTTREMEEAWLRDRVSQEIDFIRANVNVDLSPNQEASLASLSYNIGRNAFKNSEALKFLNKGDIKSFAFEAFDPQKGFVKMGDKIIPGLQNRREKERLMFFEN
jgi:GH24 family phage-related lysozyme (muramidase)|tara:strand:- start:38 stop:568 length:531 start_codon:yes stop_codon:yes gene_type:complete